MRKAFLVLVVIVMLYFAFWPVPIAPERWNPSPSPGFAGAYAPNAFLAAAERIDLPEGTGPEDVAVDTLGRIYAGLADGRLVRLRADGTGFEVLADTEGRPLGLHFDALGNLLVADADKGLLSLSPDGTLTVLATEADGVPFALTDDVDVGPDGTVYFSDASSKFNIGDYKADILENAPNGRLLAYDPDTGTTRVLLDGLYFANGVAVAPDGAYVLVNETSRYRVRRYWLEGPRQGTSDVFIDNLPAFPDGISSGVGGVFWLGLVSPRNALVDALGPYPTLRKALFRLPDFLLPKPVRYAFVLGLDAEGRVVHNLQEPSGIPVATISSAQQHGGWLYLGCLEEAALGRIAVP